MTRSGSTAVGVIHTAAALIVLVALFVVARAPSVSAAVERRVALVIGNGGYKSVPALPNPPGDAKAVAAALKRLGFEVTDGYDLTVAEMRAKIAAFFSTLPDSKAAVIYYAGHGVSVDGENFLVPTDVVLKGPADLDLQAIDMSLLLKQLKREDRVNVIILDACRDNPFAGDLANTKTRAIVGDRGLSAIDTTLAKGTLIAYASDPNSTALDGKPGERSPFTTALLHHLEDPDVSIGTVMDRVRTEVWAATGNRQMPWVNTSLIGEFALNPQIASLSGAAPQTLDPKAAAAPNGDRFALENRLWDSAEHGNSRDDYQAYLDSYPSGLYAPMAKSRIAKLITAEPRATQTPLQTAGLEPPSADAVKGEVGTERTEASLNLDPGQRKELQARLAALAFDVGSISGTLGSKTRAAIVGWQKNHGVAPTGWLGPLQYAALQKETDTSYQDFMDTGSGTSRHAQHLAQTRSIARLADTPRRRLPAHDVAERKPRGAGAGGGTDSSSGAAMIGSMLGGFMSHFH